MSEKPLRIWFDRIATIYRERKDGRIIMVPLESPQHRFILGEVWKGDDFDRDRNYQRLTEVEASTLEMTK